MIEHPNLHVSNHPLVRHKATLLSDRNTNPRLFSSLAFELAQILVFEATADLPTRQVQIETPLELATGEQIDADIALVPILRAGLGMVDGAAALLPNATIYHLGIYRDETSHRPISYYNKLPPSFDSDVMLLLDPMLATAGSASAAASALKQHGATKIKFVGLIAAPEGIARMADEHADVALHIARVDRELDENKYIRPGLGDAGDRLFGT